jgi:RNA polymerase sigma-70 factor (ECF subfamily)
MADDGSDGDLAQRAAAGERAAFAALAERHYDRVYALAWRFAGARAEAEDIAQDAMVKMAMSIRAFRGDCAFATWAWRIAYTVAIDHIRANRKVVPFSPELAAELADCPAEGSPEDEVMGQDLWRAVRALPDQQRDAVLLVYAQDMSHQKTVSWHLHEARKRLRNRLEAV